MTEHTKIDLTELAREIQRLKPRSQLYEVLKRELSRIDHWKAKHRGKPKKHWPYGRPTLPH